MHMGKMGKIANSAIAIVGQDKVELNFDRGRGVSWTEIPRRFLQLAILRNCDTGTEDVRAEVICMLKGETEIKTNPNDDQLFVVLGTPHKFPNPIAGRAYDCRSEQWIPVAARDRFRVPRGQPYGFSVPSEGSMWLLVVKAPPDPLSPLAPKKRRKKGA